MDLEGAPVLLHQVEFSLFSGLPLLRSIGAQPRACGGQHGLKARLERRMDLRRELGRMIAGNVVESLVLHSLGVHLRVCAADEPEGAVRLTARGQ